MTIIEKRRRRRARQRIELQLVLLYSCDMMVV